MEEEEEAEAMAVEEDAMDRPRRDGTRMDPARVDRLAVVVAVEVEVEAVRSQVTLLRPALLPLPRPPRATTSVVAARAARPADATSTHRRRARRGKMEA
jgi:hypothetical protein